MDVNIYFYNGNNATIENHYFQKEYRNDVVVQIGDLFYEVYFFTKDALEYEMRKDGFFALPGIIILDDITFQKIIIGISYPSKSDFFATFKGHTESPINKRFVKQWYRNEQTVYDTSELYIHNLIV